MRRVVLTAVIAFLFSACAARPPETMVTPQGVRFALPAPKAISVAVAGSFNGWDAGAHRLAGPDEHGIWTVTLPLPPGRYEYLFVINGTEWAADPSAPAVDDGFGGRNSVIVVGR
jgi:1,4-alpha-glucan branching enzyme